MSDDPKPTPAQLAEAEAVRAAREAAPKCPDPECDHPVERHNAHWGGCKYCSCGWLPPQEDASVLLRRFIDMRDRLTTNRPGLTLVPETTKAMLQVALDAAIQGLQNQGIRPVEDF